MTDIVLHVTYGLKADSNVQEFFEHYLAFCKKSTHLVSYSLFTSGHEVNSIERYATVADLLASAAEELSVPIM